MQDGARVTFLLTPPPLKKCGKYEEEDVKEAREVRGWGGGMEAWRWKNQVGFVEFFFHKYYIEVYSLKYIAFYCNL